MRILLFFPLAYLVGMEGSVFFLAYALGVMSTALAVRQWRKMAVPR